MRTISNIYTKRIERWDIDGQKVGKPANRATVEKIAVRDVHGRFHGSTNYNEVNGVKVFSFRSI